MALHFDYSKIPSESPRSVGEGEDERMHPVLNALIWMTIPLGLYELTARNLNEWLVRVRIYERLFGAFLCERQDAEQPPVDRPITREDLVAYIGMGTNASTLTRAQFLKNCVRRMEREVDDALRRAGLEAAKSL